VLINLVPEFLSVLQARDRTAAYRQYLDSHRAVLHAYWRNYVLDPDSPQASDIIARTVAADHGDLTALLEQVDLTRVLEDTLSRAQDLLQVDRTVDTYVMVGVGGANAGELVVGGRGVAFVCLEHFTGRANPETFGMGLAPRLIGLWLGHEIGHTVRYCAADSASELRHLIEAMGGYYDSWQAGSRIRLRELLVNEGLAVHAAQAIAPGHDPADYFGYPRRQYQRLREMEAFLRSAVHRDLDRAALGLRLRYLTGGMSPAARLVNGRVIPERSGYYLGYRMAEPLVQQVGIAKALRASLDAVVEADEIARGIRTA